jgi:hypothetical protein
MRNPIKTLLKHQASLGSFLRLVLKVVREVLKVLAVKRVISQQRQLRSHFPTMTTLLVKTSKKAPFYLELKENPVF